MKPLLQVLAFALFCASAITAGGPTAVPASLDLHTQTCLFREATFWGDQPVCNCKCGGEIRCDPGQWAYCECRDHNCHGSCSSAEREPMDLAADVLTYVVRKRLTPADLREQRNTYYPLLDKLLASKVSPGRYLFVYEDREIGFSFTEKAVALLRQALENLKANIPSN